MDEIIIDEWMPTLFLLALIPIAIALSTFAIIVHRRIRWNLEQRRILTKFTSLRPGPGGEVFGKKR